MEELNAQLVSLVGDDGAEMLISAFRSRRSISGPESGWMNIYNPEHLEYKISINASK